MPMPGPQPSGPEPSGPRPSEPASAGPASSGPPLSGQEKATAPGAVGGRVRAFREERGLGLEDVAATTGLERDFLERLEAGRLYPPIGPLQKVARALGVRLGTFLDDMECGDPVRSRIADTSNADSHAASGEAGTPGMEPAGPGYEYQTLGMGKSDRNMEPFCVRIYPRRPRQEDDAEDDTAAEPKLSSHQGEEFILVLEGRLSVIYGREHYELSPGETIYYNSTVPHWLGAAGGEPVRILAVAYNP